MAATRNTELVKQVSKITAKELRASGAVEFSSSCWILAVSRCGHVFLKRMGKMYIGKTMGASGHAAYQESGLINQQQ